MNQARNVTELRKAGKLHEAQALAKLLLQEDETNWSARAALCWVFWAQLKAQGDQLRKHSADSVTSKMPPVNAKVSLTIQQVLNDYATLKPETPDLYHSQILFTLRDIGRHLPEFVPFLQKFPDRCFREEDFTSAKSPDGKDFAPLAVAVSREAIKWCLTQTHVKRSSAQWVYGWTSPVFTRIQDPFLAMDLAQLCARLKQPEDAVEYTRILLASKRNEPWAWKVLADVALRNSEDDVAASALCRACEIGRNEEFTGSYRLLLASILVREHQYAWAAQEAEHVRSFYNSRGWGLKVELTNILHAEWFVSALAERFDAEAARRSRSQRAIERLCEHVEDIDACYVGLDFKRRPTYIARIENDARLLTDYSRRATLNLAAGQSVTIRLGRLDNKIEILSIDIRSDASAWSAVPLFAPTGQANRPDGSARRFKATIRKMPAGFGFLQGDPGVFVRPELATHLEDNQVVEAVAVWQLNKKKNQMGWSAIALL